MEACARAGIDIYDTVLRYAEVEQYGSRYRLLRLGSCDFDFNLTNDLIVEGKKESIETISEALYDVFTGSIASELQVTLHPPSCYSFFVPITANLSDADRKVRLQQETAVLAGVDMALRLSADAVYTERINGGEPIDWVHVLAVREEVFDRFERILKVLPHARHRFVVSMHSAATTMITIDRRLAGLENENRPYVLAVGWYPSHIEYTLCRQNRWYFSHYTKAGSHCDSAYFAVALLNHVKIKPSEIGQVYLYGTGVDSKKFGYFQSIFSLEPEYLNPLSVVDLDPGSLTSNFDSEAYVPCVGAAL